MYRGTGRGVFVVPDLVPMSAWVLHPVSSNPKILEMKLQTNWHDKGPQILLDRTVESTGPPLLIKYWTSLAGMRQSKAIIKPYKERDTLDLSKVKSLDLLQGK